MMVSGCVAVWAATLLLSAMPAQAAPYDKRVEEIEQQVAMHEEVIRRLKADVDNVNAQMQGSPPAGRAALNGESARLQKQIRSHDKAIEILKKRLRMLLKLSGKAVPEEETEDQGAGRGDSGGAGEGGGSAGSGSSDVDSSGEGSASTDSSEGDSSGESY